MRLGRILADNGIRLVYRRRLDRPDGRAGPGGPVGRRLGCGIIPKHLQTVEITLHEVSELRRRGHHA